MDNLTHGLTGAVMAQAGLKKKTGLGLAALVLGANLPDIDVVSMLWLEGQETLGFRRGITHGPIGVALLPLGLAALLSLFDRWQTKRGKRPEGRAPVRFKWLYLLGLIGAISHVLMDWLNSYGVRFLYPFDTSWYYGDTLFIIDVWLWALLIGCVWWASRREKKGGDQRRIARGAIAAMLVYIGVNWGITWNAVAERAADGEVVIASPRPLMFVFREMIVGGNGRYSLWGTTQAGSGVAGTCKLEPAIAGAKGNSKAEAFLVWSRTPFAERAEDGSVILYDARFYDPHARDRFSIALPDLPCEELTTP